MFIALEHTRHRNDLFAQLARLLDRLRSHLALIGEIISRLARDAVFHCEIRRGRGHAEIAVGIGQRRSERVCHPCFTQRNAPARAAEHMGCLAHVLRAAGQDPIGFAHQ